MPRRLGEAVVAVEDEHFYSNVFLNAFDGAARAALASLHTSSNPGGSTIAQQLAKQLYVGSGGLGAALEQIGLGVKLALGYSKAEILSLTGTASITATAIGATSLQPGAISAFARAS